MKTNYIKYLIIVIVVILIIVGIFFLKENKKNLKFIEENYKYELNYFPQYTKEGTVGVISKTGEEIIESKYEDIYIPNPEKDVFICIIDDENSIILNSKKEEIFKEFSNIEPIKIAEENLEFEKNILKYEENSKFGLIDFSGNIVLKPEYDSIESLKYKPGKLLVKKDQKYGVFDDKGNLVIQINYDGIEGDGFCTGEEGYTQTGYIIKEKMQSDFLYGYINVKGTLIFKPEFESIERILNYKDTQNSYLIGMKNGKKGVYKNSKQIIENNYKDIEYSNTSNIIVAKTTKNNLFFNLEGKKILDSKYKEYTLAGNYISVLEGDVQKLYDINGNFITNQSYKKIQETENSNYIITVDENGYYSIMNKSTVIKDNYKNLEYAYDDYFIFTTEENKVGVLDVWKGVIIKPEYDSILKIENANCLEAKKEDETTIYSKNLEKISTISGAIVENLKDNFVVVYSENEMIYLNQDGSKVQNTEIYKENELYSIKENGKWGFIDKNGQIKVNSNYDIVTELNEYGFAGIKKDGKWGIINKEGKVISDPQYEIDTYYFPKFIGKNYLEQTDTLHCIKLEE